MLNFLNRNTPTPQVDPLAAEAAEGQAKVERYERAEHQKWGLYLAEVAAEQRREVAAELARTQQPIGDELQEDAAQEDTAQATEPAREETATDQEVAA